MEGVFIPVCNLQKIGKAIREAAQLPAEVLIDYNLIDICGELKICGICGGDPLLRGDAGYKLMQNDIARLFAQMFKVILTAGLIIQRDLDFSTASESASSSMGLVR